MNLVQIGTNEFFPNSPLLNSRKPSTTTQEIERIPLCYALSLLQCSKATENRARRDFAVLGMSVVTLQR
jgi:hypothetical protein